MRLELKNIIKPEFGPIRQVYYNKSVDAFLFETDYGFQFIYTDNKIIIDNVSQQFKIIGNTFSKGQVSFITKKGLHKIDIIDLVKKQTNSFGKWGDIDYTSIFIASLKFPFLQYYSGRLNSIEFSDRLILVDDQLGIICYNVLSEEIEFNFDISQNSVSSHFHPEIDNEIYWANIDKFEISEDEKYFYVLTAYEGKSLFVFRTTDYSLLYHELGSYALSFGIFYNDNFVIPSGFDYDSDDKQPFKVINLLNGERQTIELDLGLIQDFHFGAKFKNLVIAYNQLSNSETYNYSRCIQAINLDDIVNLKIITRKEINIKPQIVLNDNLLKDLIICDNHLIILDWNNNISLHLITYKEENDMEQLITSIYQTLEDYRADENRPNVRITTDSIRNWINQFDNDLRAPILAELDNIFKKRYCSKSKVKNFLDQVIQVLTKDFGFKSANEFLKNSDFLNLQPEGKSQRIMLSLLDELIQEKYKLSLADCGTTSKKYSIYLDDILCTGLTLISDIKEWSEQIFSGNKTNGQAVADSSTTLVFAYVFIHEKNYRKKVAEMRHKISNDVSSKHKMYRLIEIENGTSQSSKIDLLYPLEIGQPQSVTYYKNEIIERVDNHTKKYNTVSQEEFFRPAGQPSTEQFFTSAENRIIVENAFLQKGIEILRNANPTNKNMRALGYSIPALKNFGFGALCFTWRNVPNNAPLVFWYSGGGFTPLFKVTRGGNFFFNIESENESFYNGLSEEWKEIVKWNIIGLDTERDREKVFTNTYHPSKDELNKIENIDELWVNWWENDPPNDDFGVSDLSPIKKIKNLKSIVIRSLNIEDCAPIASCKNLKSLLIQHSKVNNLEFLADLTSLEILDLRYNPITNIQPIRNLVNLTSLDLSSTNVENIDSLSGLTNLQSLSIGYTNIYSLEPLSNLINLRELWLGDTNVTSISPLFGLKLQYLVINNDNVNDTEVSCFVKQHPKCRVFFKGTTYNESRNNIDLPF